MDPCLPWAWYERLVKIHFREGVILLFVYEWDGLILKNLVEELIFHTYVSCFHSIHHNILHLTEHTNH